MPHTPPTAWYFYRLKEDDFVQEFCVANAQDPNQFVETFGPDGQMHRWAKRQEGDLLVFRPPDAYHGSQGLGWSYDPKLQRGEPMNREQLERRALRGRVSVHFGG